MGHNKSGGYGAIPRLEQMNSDDLNATEGAAAAAAAPSHSFTTTPLMRTWSESVQTLSRAASTSVHTLMTEAPLVRTFSEGVQTLTLADFALSAQARHDDDRLHHDPAAGTATIPSEVANMTKNLIGGGVLSLSGGMALFTNDPSAASRMAVIYWVVGLGAVLGYFCLL